MRIRYETGVMTLVQFIAVCLLGIANFFNSAITTCVNTRSDCISNIIVSAIYFLLIALWFGFLATLGYAAQDRRSKRLAQLLIAAEGLVALIALFNARHHNDALGLITSLVDLALALWVVLLAFRLMRAGGGRVVVKQRGRARQRRRPTAR